MKRKYKPVLRVLALIMALVCLGVSLAPASFAFAGVLDPGAWLYPIWSIYGASNGVNVTTSGDADFTIDGMTSLWNDYQSDLVSSGLQSAAQSLSDFVSGAQGLVTVVANTVAGSTLGTKLQIGRMVVRTLASFWNWIIKEKLGGTSVDSIDFDSSAGNMYQVSGWPQNGVITSLPFYFGTRDGRIKSWYNDYTGGQKYIFGYIQDGYNSICVFSLTGPFSFWFNPGDYSASAAWVYENSIYYAILTRNYQIGNFTDIPVYSTLQDGLAAAYAALIVGGTSGDLTVEPQDNVDVLGFPDVSDQDYVPADAVIPWNIPYDQTKDTLDYIDAAFADAVTNDLEIGEAGSIVDPVPGVGPVGDYVAPGLGDVFPFCIPFDIYDFLSALASDPVAPSFTAELAFPAAVGGTQTVELDFDTPTWNTLAQILRTMELLAFIVGLALITRSLFLRG